MPTLLGLRQEFPPTFPVAHFGNRTLGDEAVVGIDRGDGPRMPIRRLDPNCSRTSPSLNARNVTGLNTTVHVVHAVRRRFVRRSRRDRHAGCGGSRAGKCRTVNGDGGRIDSARLPRTVVRKSPRVP